VVRVLAEESLDEELLRVDLARTHRWQRLSISREATASSQSSVEDDGDTKKP
jgi:hypothetical protein